MKRAATSMAMTCAALGILIFGHGVGAYTINTGFTRPCHETIIYEGLESNISKSRLDPDSMVPLPAGDRWKDVLEYLCEGMDVEFSSDRERFLALSLIIASRYPDNRGKSVTNAKSLREIHRDPDNQDSHFLRSADDDYSQGNLSAIAAGLEHMRNQVITARYFRGLSPKKQIITTPIYIEYYGLVNVSVWAPAFYMGVATHAVQDSFSHTVRSDDLHTIRHVANYVDAVTFDYDLERDGLRHSWAMDRCEEEASEIAIEATAATEDFLTLLGMDQFEMEPALDAFFEKWMGYEDGCDDSNDYCDSIWASVARTDPSLPVWEDYFGCECTVAVGESRKGGLLAVLLLFVTAFAGIALRGKTR